MTTKNTIAVHQMIRSELGVDAMRMLDRRNQSGSGDEVDAEKKDDLSELKEKMSVCCG